MTKLKGKRINGKIISEVELQKAIICTKLIETNGRGCKFFQFDDNLQSRKIHRFVFFKCKRSSHNISN